MTLFFSLNFDIIKQGPHFEVYLYLPFGEIRLHYPNSYSPLGARNQHSHSH